MNKIYIYKIYIYIGKVSEKYRLVESVMGADNQYVRFIPQSWTSMVQIKMNHFKALSHYFVALALSHKVSSIYLTEQIFVFIFLESEEDLRENVCKSLDVNLYSIEYICATKGLRIGKPIRRKLNGDLYLISGVSVVVILLTK